MKGIIENVNNTIVRIGKMSHFKGNNYTFAEVVPRGHVLASGSNTKQYGTQGKFSSRKERIFF